MIKVAGTFDLGAMLAEPQLSVEYKRAAEVDAQIKQSAMQAQQNLYDMAMGFKKMRDEKLYTALGYENFGEYCENETGMKRRNVYNYIAIAEKLPQEFVHSSAQIGIKKLTLLSTLDEEERTEIVETTDLESSTVKELKEKIASLKTANERLMTKVDEAKVKAEKSSASESKAWGKVSVLQTDSDLQKQKISQLEAQVKDLENRPVEVAVMDDSKEVTDLKDAIKRIDREWSKKYSVLEEQLEAADANKDKLNFELCAKQAKQALNSLLKACLNYGGGHIYAEAICKSFLKDLKKYEEETNNE